jgi:PEP-CTERM motif
MQRICGVTIKLGIALLFVATADRWTPARGDLIRSNPARSFPDIAGDIVGSQTYTYDPVTETGTFAFVNAPHLIALGPSAKEMVHLHPDEDGTLTQSLQLKLDRFGRLIVGPHNRFEIRGSVVIGDRTYQGLLLEGRPTAFGAEAAEGGSNGSRNSEVFDLNMQITGGQLANAFGQEAYLRIVPQADSTFNGQFTSDFSSAKPLSNLRAARKGMPATVPEPTTLVTLLTFGAGALAYRLRRRLANRTPRRRGAVESETVSFNGF